MRTRSLVVTGILAIIAVSGGCGETILGADPTTGVAVLVTRGPLQPVAMDGEVNEEPVPGATVRVRSLGSGGTAEAVTGSDGAAVLLLLPGTYRLSVTKCPGALALPGDSEVMVTTGTLQTAVLACDTGIR